MIMTVKKIYKCCLCGQVLVDYKPIRLVKQLHDNKVPYGAYHNIKNYDFCKKCYAKLDNWLTKNGGNNEKN